MTAWSLVDATSAGVRLHGLAMVPTEPSSLVIHVHGTWGNFYANSFVSAFADAYHEQGIAFAAVNFPGHDETAMNERLENFAPALDAWIEKLAVSRSTPVVIQGHSLGALKCLSLVGSDGYHDQVRGLVALSPFDCVGFYSRESNLAELASLESDSEIVPESIFPHWLLRKSTLVELSTDGGDWDVFRSRRPESGVMRAAIPVPSLLVMGGSDFASVPSPRASFDSAREFFSSAEFIDDAPHGFDGFEVEAARVVSEWVRGITGRRV